MKHFNWILMVMVFGVAAIFNACSAEHEGDGTLSSTGNGECDAILKAGFTQQNGTAGTSFHGYLKNMCASCHASGNVIKFAQDNVDEAFGVFWAANDAASDYRIADYGTTPHGGGGGLADPATMSALNNSWVQAEASFKTCLDEKNNGEPGPPGIDESIKKYTSAKGIGGNLPTTIQWNLGNEMAVGSDNIAGASVRITIDEWIPVEGETGYQVTDVELTGGNNPVHAANLRIAINGTLVPYPNGSTFRGVDRWIPAGQTRNICRFDRCSPMLIPTATAAADTISLAFVVLEEDVGGTFDPPTFNELNAAGGVFANNCVGCHSGATPDAGLDMSLYRYVINAGSYVAPFTPEQSLILERMKNTAAPMPPAGVLPANQVQQVEDWILDGAPAQ